MAIGVKVMTRPGARVSVQVIEGALAEIEARRGQDVQPHMAWRRRRATCAIPEADVLDGRSCRIQHRFDQVVQGWVRALPDHTGA